MKYYNWFLKFYETLQGEILQMKFPYIYLFI